MITGLNHLTISVENLDRSLPFYIDILGFVGHARWNTGAYLSFGNLWLCLSVGESAPASDYSHIAFDIKEQDFDAFNQTIKKSRVIEWKKNRSEGKSIYILDPDGHKLEIHVGTLATRLESLKAKPYDGLKWLSPEAND